MSTDAVKLDDEVIVAIPDESVKIRDGEPAVPAQEKKDPPARVSALARSGRSRDDAPEKDERIAALEREREEARREAEAARAALAEAAEFARQAQAGRVTAEDTARLREQQAMRAHVLRLQSDKSQIEGAISATQSEAAMAQRELIQAIEAGDAKRQAEAQHAIAKAEAALSQLENGKYAADTELSKANRLFEEHEQARTAARKAEPAPERRAEPQPEAMTPDKWIDTTVRQVLGDKGADWLRENKQFATDTKLNRKFLRFADEYAEDHGQGALKSAEFLEALNDKFFPDREEREPEPERVAERQRPTARATSAAPVSRTNNQFFSSRNLNAAQVKLPPKLASFVKQSGLNPTEYALQCVADIKAGKLPKDYLDPDYDHGI